MSTANPVNEIDKLKSQFVGEIDSKRVYDRIKTLDDLVQVLCDRDIFFNVLGRESVNDTENDLKTIAYKLNTNKQNNYLLPDIVIEKIALKIGGDWKLLGNLWKINFVDQATDIESTFKLLRAFEKHCGRVSIKEIEYRLIRGFQKIRRQDLEDILIQLSQT